MFGSTLESPSERDISMDEVRHEQEHAQEEQQASRRELLTKIRPAYVAPTLIALSLTRKLQAASSPPDGPPDPP